MGRRGGVRQERRSPRRNCVGVEKGKKKLKSKDPTSRRIKARRGASSSELPLFFFFNFYFPSGAEGSGSQAGGPQRTCREMRWIPPERRRSPYLPAGPRQVAQQRSGTRDVPPAEQPVPPMRTGGAAAVPLPNVSGGGHAPARRLTTPRQPLLRGTRRRAAAVAWTRPCDEPGTVPRALRVPCSSPSVPRRSRE